MEHQAIAVTHTHMHAHTCYIYDKIYDMYLRHFDASNFYITLYNKVEYCMAKLNGRKVVKIDEYNILKMFVLYEIHNTYTYS